MKTKVMVTGMGVVTPVGIGLKSYWDALIHGKSGAGRVSLFDSAAYTCHIDAEIRNWDPLPFVDDRKKVKHMDRFTQFGFAAARMAIEDSGIDFQKTDRTRVGVIIGSGIGGLSTIEEEHRALLDKGPRRISPYMIPMLITNICPAEVAIAWDLQGVNYSVSSACATASHALGDALRLLRYGDADVVVAGGSEAAITPLGFGGFCAARTLSTRNDDPARASRPFDRDRDGFLMGEGAGVVVLETEAHARARGARIYAELAGYGATDDAYHVTAPGPNAEASSRAIAMALQDGGINLDEVDYINAHGTSTSLNDKTETLAIKKVFGERAYKIPVSSTKSMTGHLLGAAGAVEAIATILSMQHGMLHPTINLDNPDPDCDLDYVPHQAREKTVRVGISNSLGFGGHNACLALRAAS